MLSWKLDRSDYRGVLDKNGDVFQTDFRKEFADFFRLHLVLKDLFRLHKMLNFSRGLAICGLNFDTCRWVVFFRSDGEEYRGLLLMVYVNSEKLMNHKGR